jgi:hypothetical protein
MTDGDAFSAIEANVLPIARRIATALSSCATAEAGAANSTSIDSTKMT